MTKTSSPVVINFKVSNRSGIFSLISLLIFTTFGFSLSLSENYALYALGQIVVFSLMWSWFSVLHTCGHQSYVKNKKINFFIGHIASLITFVPFYSWKYHHDEHHRWTGWKENDPTVSDAPDEMPNKAVMKFLDFCWNNWIPIFSISHALTNFWNPKRMNQILKSDKKKKESLFSQLFLVIYMTAFLLIAPAAYFKIFGIAMILFLVSGDIILLSQHVHLPVYKTLGKQVKPHNDHEQFTRSIYIHPLIDRYVLLNFNLHNVHHCYPTIPHYFLHKVEFEPKNKVTLKAWIIQIKKMSVSELFWPQDLQDKRGMQNV